MLVSLSSALVLVGSLGVILAEPTKTGASSPTRRTSITKEAAEAKAQYRCHYRPQVRDGAVSPRRIQRNSSDLDSESEKAERQAILQQLRETQARASGDVSPRKRYSESQLDEAEAARSFVHLQRGRTASQTNGLRSGSDSPRRKIFSDVVVETQRNTALQREELETRKKAEKEALELEAQRRAEKEALELEAQRRAEKETLELEAQKKVEKEALELETQRKAEKEALELEARKKAALDQMKLEDGRKKASLQREQSQTDGYASDTDALKSTQFLARQDSLNRRKSRFLDFSTPKVFQSVCELEKVNNKDPKMNEACQKQCIELSNQIDDIYKNYPHMVKIEALHNECSGFSQGSCKKTSDFKGKKMAACTCLGWTDNEKVNFKSQYAAVCRASLSGLKVITNLNVATESVRKGVKKMISKWRNRSKKSKRSK